jgi:hypothetical protein
MSLDHIKAVCKNYDNIKKAINFGQNQLFLFKMNNIKNFKIAVLTLKILRYIILNVKSKTLF